MRRRHLWVGWWLMAVTVGWWGLAAGCRPNAGQTGHRSSVPPEDSAATTRTAAGAGADSSTPPGHHGSTVAQDTANELKEASSRSVPEGSSASAKRSTQQDSSPMAELNHPFPHRVPMPEFPETVEWLNSAPLKLADLRGKLVLLDFWTYCCINCMHILPELKKLEQMYANQLVVIGVHSAKFDSEQITDNIAAAILRYDIEHPVFNDRGHQYWDTLGVRSWPTIVLIDPEGQAIWARAGEIEAKDVQPILDMAISHYRSLGKLDERPVKFPLLAYRSQRTALRFPGKILADGAGNRLFISDSNHHRIVIATLEGNLVEVIGSGRLGAADGSYEECSFNKPQGMALHEETLYVADTENHLIRKVDLRARRVTTVAGTGVQSRAPWPGLDALSPLSGLPDRWVGPPAKTALNSPWDVWVHDGALYIAMAGCHQIWKMPLDESEIGPYAGNAREDIVDGPLLPPRPYELGAASFAQPSGLTSDGTWLYVADSEGSSIRAVPFDPSQSVRTVVGTAHLPYGRLFAFGDRDGKPGEVLLQHCLAVVYHEGRLYVADTYNNKIKVVDAQTGETSTLAGTGEAGRTDDPPRFYEPAGLALARNTLYVADTNNHLIRTVDLATGKVATLTISGLQPPEYEPPPKPQLADAVHHELPTIQWKPVGDQVRMRVELELPDGWKLNPEAPVDVWLEAEGSQTGLLPAALGHRQITPAKSAFELTLPASAIGSGHIVLSMICYYCESEDGLCKAESVVWRVPFQLSSQTGQEELVLKHTVR